VPAGFKRLAANGGASVALPDDWKRLPDNPDYPSGTYFSGPGGGRLMVDWTSKPGASSLANWQHDSKAYGPSMPGYRLIGVKKAVYRDYDAADWEYKRTLSGTQVRVQNRGMVTDAHHGYALLFTFPVDAWNSDTNRHIREVVLDTFKPAK